MNTTKEESNFCMLQYISDTYWNGESRLPNNADVAHTVSTVEGLQKQIDGLKTQETEFGVIFVAIPDLDVSEDAVKLVKMSVNMELLNTQEASS